MTRKHSHYFKDVSKLQTIDVYRVLALFEVTDPCLQHAVKKLLVAGGRGAKDVMKDVQEAMDTLQRWQEMRGEDCFPVQPGLASALIEVRVSNPTPGYPDKIWYDMDKWKGRPPPGYSWDGDNSLLRIVPN